MTVEMVPCVLNGKYDLILPAHRAARPEWYTSEGWERARLDSMADHLGPGDLIVDVGAEEGEFGALAASWGADVVLVEPSARTWPNIRAVYEANELTERVRGCFVGFAGDVERGGTSDLSDGWPICAYGEVIGDHGFVNLSERPDISAVRVDTLAEWFGAPTALTIDVEGSELHVLRGAEGVLRECRPLVWVSVHPPFMADLYGHRPADLFGFMQSVGYGREFLELDHECHFLFAPRADW